MNMPSRAASGFLAVTLVAVIAVGGAHVIDSSSQPAASSAGATVVTVARGTVGKPIPAGFVGLSMEFRGLEAYAGADPKAVNPVFAQLLRNLAPDQQGVLRIGGDGTDWTWWPVPHMARPGGVRYDLNRDWMEVAKSLSKTAGLRLILGINLEADSTRVAAAEASAMLGDIGSDRIEGLEIGNEPELYGSFPWYKAPDGVHVRGRPPGYNFADFLREYSTMARAISRGPLAGPSTGAPLWIPELGQFLAAEPRVRVATLHRYPLKHCGKSAPTLTVGELLASSSSAGLANGIARYAGIAHSHHVPLRIDELNAVSCGGQRGVSDTFASALWALDSLFEMARVGVDGVNFHTVPKTINELISARLSGGKWSSYVHPQYYGMMMFAQAAPAGARLLRVSGATGALHVWATRARNGQLRVALINDDPHAARQVAVRLPVAHGTATLERLAAPAVGAKSGVTLGGQSFGARTTTGLLAGKSQISSVKPSGRSYSVRLPAGSAALMTVSG
jgi:Glycosyl hydrolase family 79 C-terminal beta domain